MPSGEIVRSLRMAVASLTGFRFVTILVLTIAIAPILCPLTLITNLVSLVFLRRCKKSVANEIAVVTGSGHGLGRHLAVELAQNGCAIAVVDINGEEAETTAQHIRDTFNVAAKAYVVDVANYEQVKIMHENICDDLGIPTILVNNAGVLLLKDPLNPSAEDMQKMINVNFTSHFYTNKVFLPKMKELNKGHIVAISSVSAVIPIMYNSVYASSKSAVRTLMRCLRLELKAGNPSITTTTVFPYFLNTNDAVHAAISEAKISKIIPTLDGELVAKRIVEGILHNEDEIMIPEYNHLSYRLLELLPNVFMDPILMCIQKYIYSFRKGI